MHQTNQEVSVRRGPRFPLSLRFWWGIGLALAVGVWTTPVEAASVSLTVLGSPNLGQPWAVQVTTNARGSVSVQFWINGALAQTESVTPYCSFGDPGTACTRVQQPAGSYTV